MPRIVSEPIRFHLAEDRVRDLLMGTNLYGDSDLALREVYQNAIDACRRADARAEYVTRVADAPPGPVGATRVRVVQGVSADGSTFIECVDDGCGMDVDEIAQGFCQAGVRADDLPGAKDERERYAELHPPIELWTNSRFGIGALSYFMIADRIEIVTTRVGLDGVLGPRLRAVIEGPTSEFVVIEDEEPSTARGTTVRLTVRPSISINAVTVLRDHVIVAPFDVTAVMEPTGYAHAWSAGRFNAASSRLDESSCDVIADPGGIVWWCEGRGQVLADGILTAATTFGAHINLTGPDAPTLTADRWRIVDRDDAAVDRALVAAAPSAAIDGAFTTAEAWLESLFSVNHVAADALVEVLVEQSIAIHEDPSTVSQQRIATGSSGFVPGDRSARDLWSLTRACYTQPASHGLDVDSWPRPLPGRPSDAVFLDRGGQTMRGEERVPIRSWRSDAASVYHAAHGLGWPLARVIERARELGVGLPDNVDELPESTPFIMECVKRAGVVPPLRAVDFYDCSLIHGLSLAEALAAAERHSIAVSPRLRSLVANPPTLFELTVVSQTGGAVGPWRERVSLLDVVEQIARTGARMGEVIAALRRFDIECPILGDVSSFPPLTEPEARALSRDLDGAAPYVRSPLLANSGDVVAPTTGRTVSATGLSKEAIRDLYARYRVQKVAARLPFAPETFAEFLQLVADRRMSPNHAQEWGRKHHALPFATQLRTGFDALDARLATRDLDGELPVRRLDRVILAVDVGVAMTRLDVSAAELDDRWTALGYTVNAPAARRLRKWEKALLSDDFDGRHPWLDGTRVSAEWCLRAAMASRRPVSAIVDFYRSLDLVVDDPRDILPVLRPGDDPASQRLPS